MSMWWITSAEAIYSVINVGIITCTIPVALHPHACITRLWIRGTFLLIFIDLFLRLTQMRDPRANLSESLSPPFIKTRLALIDWSISGFACALAWIVNHTGHVYIDFTSLTLILCSLFNKAVCFIVAQVSKSLIMEKKMTGKRTGSEKKSPLYYPIDRWISYGPWSSRISRFPNCC